MIKKIFFLVIFAVILLNQTSSVEAAKAVLSKSDPWVFNANIVYLPRSNNGWADNVAISYYQRQGYNYLGTLTSYGRGIGIMSKESGLVLLPRSNNGWADNVAISYYQRQGYRLYFPYID